jgi:hypothetical protein
VNAASASAATSGCTPTSRAAAIVAAAFKSM